MMNVFEAIEKRHSYRGAFTDAPVPRGDLLKIVEAGIRAPSGFNLQSTEFVIVDDADLIARIGEITGNKTVSRSKALIACVSQEVRPPSAPEMSFEIEDCSAATENILLAITALGYASVWIDGCLRRENRAARVGELLGVPEDRTVRIVLPVGVPAEERAQKEKKAFEQRARYNKWS